MCPWSSIASSTVRRRAFAARGCVTGSQRDGPPGCRRATPLPRGRASSRCARSTPSRRSRRPRRSRVDGVQVRGEDLRLRPVPRPGLELPRERRLLELARDRPLVPDERVLDELLRDRRSALHGALVADVLPQRADDAVDVDAAVLVEALVLDVDDRVLHPRRDVVPADELARLLAPEHREDRVPVVGVDIAVDLAGLSAPRVERRKLAARSR